jgi:hypothetical protein
MILNTEDYTHKTVIHLEDPKYRRLNKNPTEAIQRKTSALIRRSSLPEKGAKLLRP